mmetsp:Transcript_23480/g.52199  ORF Transcript_23480/g.52199 Transcript_23480/m.52199 type:complete len:504 (-) Transcript_23480:58-1569(-)
MHVCACFVTVDCKRTATVPFAPALLCCGFLPRADTVRFPALARSAPQPASLRSVPFRLFLVSSRRHQFLSKAGAVVFPNQRRQEFPRPLGSLPGAPCVHHRVVAQEEDVPLLPHHVDRQVLADVPGLQQHVQRDRIAVPEPDALVDPLLGGDVDERVVPAAAVSVVAVPLADPPELEGIGRGGDELVEKTFLGWLPLFAVSRCHLDGLEDGRRAPQKILSQRHARGTDAPLPVPPTGPQLCLAFLLGASVKEGLPGPPGSPGRVLVRPRKDGVPDPLFLELCANGRVPLSELPVDHGARDDPRLAAVPGPRRELAAKKRRGSATGGSGPARGERPGRPTCPRWWCRCGRPAWCGRQRTCCARRTDRRSPRRPGQRRRSPPGLPGGETRGTTRPRAPPGPGRWRSGSVGQRRPPRARCRCFVVVVVVVRRRRLPSAETGARGQRGSPVRPRRFVVPGRPLRHRNRRSAAAATGARCWCLDPWWWPCCYGRCFGSLPMPRLCRCE